MDDNPFSMPYLFKVDFTEAELTFVTKSDRKRNPRTPNYRRGTHLFHEAQNL